MFPNRFSVYLHDTPDRRLFGRSQRLLSSGCVRVERPMELAELLLGQPERWNQGSFERVIRSGKTRTVHLERPMPIILSYWTAEADANGQVRFRTDVYERDAQVLAALDGKGPIRLVYVDPRPQPEPEVSPAKPEPEVLSEVLRTGHQAPIRAPGGGPTRAF
jgi:murein L,D-transpeptidase YcbB/YkuD